jgi:hypothetical protein
MKWSFVRLQFSLRTLFVVLMPLAAVFALCVRSREPRIVRTGNPFDLAVEGPGYFCVTDQFSANRRFTRSGQLSVNAFGQLYFRIDGEDCYLTPMITLPSDADDLRKTLKITADGCVRVHSSGSEIQQGQLELFTFQAANLPQFEGPQFAADDETGPPNVWLPGAAPAGQILQGYRELRGWRWDGESIVTLLVGFVLGVVATWLLRGSNSKTATASPAPSSESPSVP